MLDNFYLKTILRCAKTYGRSHILKDFFSFLEKEKQDNNKMHGKIHQFYTDSQSLSNFLTYINIYPLSLWTLFSFPCALSIRGDYLDVVKETFFNDCNALFHKPNIPLSFDKKYFMEACETDTLLKYIQLYGSQKNNDTLTIIHHLHSLLLK